MRVVKPVFAVNALKHEVVLYKLGGLLVRVLFQSGFAVAVDVEKGLVVPIQSVHSLRARAKFAVVRHYWRATVTFKLGFAVKFMHLVSFVTSKHTSKAKSMRLNSFGQLALV